MDRTKALSTDEWSTFLQNDVQLPIAARDEIDNLAEELARRSRCIDDFLQLTEQQLVKLLLFMSLTCRFVFQNRKENIDSIDKDFLIESNNGKPPHLLLQTQSRQPCLTFYEKPALKWNGKMIQIPPTIKELLNPYCALLSARRTKRMGKTLQMKSKNHL